MSSERRPERIFISWAPYCSRSDTLARCFGAKSYLVHYFGFKTGWQAPFKYVLQALKTLWICLTVRPRIVFVMNPPVFAGLVVYFYTFLFGRKFILDSHTSAFTERKWTRFDVLHRFLARRALVSIVTNDTLGGKIEGWGGEYYLIPDVPVEFDRVPEKQVEHPHITVVNTFSADEPLDIILEAASGLPDVHFSVTGNLKRCKPEYLASKPDNVHFTDFLPDEQYVATVASSDAVLVLTTRDHTMQRGAYEAMSLELPIITSDWPLLRQTFYRGTIYTDNTVDGIMKAVRELLANHDFYKREVKTLKQERRALWQDIESRFLQAYLAS